MFEYDKEVFRSHKVKIPVGDRHRWFYNSIIIPRFTDRKELRGGRTKAEFVKYLLRHGRVVVRLPDKAKSSFMSLWPKVIIARKPGQKPVRERIIEMLSKRRFVIYRDHRSDESPMRCFLCPPVTVGEVNAAFRDAGWPIAYPNKKADAILLGSFKLLTATSKMGCLSFNLPAGPQHLHGACPSAVLGFMCQDNAALIKRQGAKADPSIEIDPESFICNGCYALKNNYSYGNTMTIIQARFMLVKALLAADQKKSVTGHGYPLSVEMLSDEAWLKSFDAVKVNQSVQGDEAVAYARKHGLITRAVPGLRAMLKLAIAAARENLTLLHQEKPAFSFSLPALRAAEKKRSAWAHAKWLRESYTQRVAAAKKSGRAMPPPPPPMPKDIHYSWEIPDPDYFRIHDSGDWFCEEYYDAWIAVVKSLPDVRFWSPTRAWANHGRLTAAMLKKIPENLALRPSSLHFREEPPSRELLFTTMKLPEYRPGKGGGLSAPSGSSIYEPTDTSAWVCPAYLHWTKLGGSLTLSRKGHGVEGTCSLAHGPDGKRPCRACWGGGRDRLYQKVVYYMEH